MHELKLISGSANKALASEVARCLKIKLTPVDIQTFNDGEIYVRILESVRGSDVFVIQPTSPNANLNLMELLIMIDALKRASPQRVTAVIPYFGYSRQDKKIKAREPISAKLVAKLIEAAGADRVMTFELHVPQVQGFFDIPSDNLDLIPIYANHIVSKNFKNLFNNNDCILRCIHSEPLPLNKLLPGQRADQEGIILFSEAGHHEIREHFEALTSSQWKNGNGQPDADKPHR